MNAQELREKYQELNEYMIRSRDPKNMMAFGKVMDEIMEWLIINKPSEAEAWIEKLESIKWKNYLTPAEADRIVSAMTPKAPWSREQWRQAMLSSGFELEEQPCYNKCALYVTMNMIMSDSQSTLSKYIKSEDMFRAVHALAVDKLKDEDGRFSIRKYFDV